MSREYAEKRILEALTMSKGNSTKARQQVIAWCSQDHKLLQALAQPHLTGIVAHAISRVVYKQETVENEDDIPETPQSLDMAPDTFGKEILKALSSDNAVLFGRDTGAAPVRRKQASQSHIDALRQMASKSKSTHKDNGEDG
ncbi:MAG: hypothetical protein HYS17_05595 [Micavibrio aeruginosavorus]|uniref:Uncharacterized protein n=1 Tax=Micavibrio aeruginosavorus TaxID=349221 RepID=A0A7T5R468_9BACT|nr:MAG: hypothetical protein HYS17_05595 [Micavibrio aeruginosavorus]